MGSTTLRFRSCTTWASTSTWYAPNGTTAIFRKCRRGGRHAGRIYGFPLGGKCFINRDCKIAPIRKYLAEIAGGPLRAQTRIVQYIGIAADEPLRLARLT